MNANLKHNHPVTTVGSRRLFNSPLLEKLSRTHIAVPLTIFLGFAVIILSWSIVYTSLSIPSTVALFTFGCFLFTWVEYNVHRYLFHIPTPTVMKRKFQYTIHGVHHRFPKDKDRLAMPPLLSITIATVMLALLKLTIGNFAFAFMAGFLTGYSAYLFVHYIVHACPQPKGFFKLLWRNHAIHHYKNGDVAFGVSSPLWDYIYRTMPTRSIRDEQQLS